MQDFVRRSMGEAVPSLLGAILTTSRVFLFVFGVVPSPARAYTGPAGWGSFSS